MEPLVSAKTTYSTSSSQPTDDDHGLAQEEPVWPTVSRNPSAILQPLSFPETPKKDLSLFTDPSKDQPIYCLICDQTFSSRNRETKDEKSCLVLSKATERKLDMDAKVDEKQEAVSGGREEGVREKEKSKVLSLQPKDEWLRHLLLEHKIVVHQVSEICSLKWYSRKCSSTPLYKDTPT